MSTKAIADMIKAHKNGKLIEIKCFQQSYFMERHIHSPTLTGLYKGVSILTTRKIRSKVVYLKLIQHVCIVICMQALFKTPKSEIPAWYRIKTC